MDLLFLQNDIQKKLKNMKFRHYIIEGCDRLSKSTLVNQIKHTYGFFQVVHYGKPEQLDYYKQHVWYNDSAYCYQIDSFSNGLNALRPGQNTKFIFDRFHLGEVVYSPRYRGYSGDYVFTLEDNSQVDTWDHVALILLTTSDWSFIQDDGDSFDFSKKEEEQHSFIEAFNKSIFKHKFLIDVNNNGFYKDTSDILAEITRGE